MSDEQIKNIAGVLEEWNPLGEKANTIDNLEGYRYEAIDIISTIKIVNGKDNVRKSIAQVLTQAFNINLDDAKLDKAADIIKTMLS